MRVLVATTNLGKIREFRDIFPSKIQILSLKDLDINIDVNEDGETFRENALKKAKEYYEISNIPTISEDSGLVVDFLNGEPGILSARYGGKDLNDDQRVDLVLKNMNGVESKQRSARFVSIICGIGFYNYPLFSEGIMEGFISDSKEGVNGFGYDPIFMPIGVNKTTASMSKHEKNNISHRRKSIDEFLKMLITDKII
ncbi:MAG: non-canonical purine NTP pyrophosphatase, RdgB/HAM1 family [Chloroflexi bacterium]|nr:non-canonical purine NTP pyrophosphatase, RdgB/HAM1 family [Chloroflexota bacterium]MBL07413.1 non-canonical purine NTP pyrophosphatase, RdgB/HAM1 family [Chloroflexota bacterium]|tara:strand:+ start:2660 stop:3253 length:594 start_codon:yes stop_codon:yes gene_type:complete